MEGLSYQPGMPGFAEQPGDLTVSDDGAGRNLADEAVDFGVEIGCFHVWCCLVIVFLLMGLCLSQVSVSAGFVFFRCFSPK